MKIEMKIDLKIDLTMIQKYSKLFKMIQYEN